MRPRKSCVAEVESEKYDLQWHLLSIGNSKLLHSEPEGASFSPDTTISWIEPLPVIQSELIHFN